MSDYQKVAKTIDYLFHHVSEQPSLATLAGQAKLSEYHFQRVFSRMVGISPKRFLQLLTLQQAQQELINNTAVTHTSENVGLSSSSRLYDHFVTLNAVTPGEFKGQGESLTITTGIHDTLYGPIFLASTPRGICQLGFVDPKQPDAELALLQRNWPKAKIHEQTTLTATLAEQLFSPGITNQFAPQRPLSLHVKGTNFQVAVWRALMRLPFGETATYSDIARQIERPRAVRAVASAIANNPVAWLIPCHRVIRKSGLTGEYRWGSERKKLLQQFESFTVA
ncbi:methylated-DNA--[protein]-cysteine S-methyltransferase [Pseudohongiella nitratireducens]|uniref:methylated-DNA--[protein]-cysteine S-methyltransferase n=1 Tax=Pseudohongiella nitratireducens TaxID=1768907 RepID=UPI0030EB81C5|tara:strand:+ start:2679 stop:3518 length:840 start_codon:yes stop_codon:yes gene_type:complete